ncbi:MAG: ion transporter [Woeseia sp.]
MNLTDLVQNQNTRAGRVFYWLVFSLILYSIVTMSIETLPKLSPATVSFLYYSEIVVTLVFTLEYILRILTSPNRLKYVTSFFGIVDLLAILPFYLSLGIDLRGIRAFRLFRIIRVLKLPRYSAAMNRLGRAFMIVREEFILFLCATLLLLYLSAVGIYFFENTVQPEKFQSIFHSLWWAVATLTTVGYGDVYPITIGGRIFTFFVLILGIGIIALPAGLVASALRQVRDEDQMRK